MKTYRKYSLVVALAFGCMMAGEITLNVENGALSLGVSATKAVADDGRRVARRTARRTSRRN